MEVTRWTISCWDAKLWSCRSCSVADFIANFDESSVKES